MKYLAGVAVALALAVGPVAAQSCYPGGVIHHNQVVHHAPVAVVKEKVVEPILVPVAVYVPAYQAFYNGPVPASAPVPPYQPPGAPAQQAAGPSAELQQILGAIGDVKKKVDRFDERLTAVESKLSQSKVFSPPPAPAQQPPPAAADTPGGGLGELRPMVKGGSDDIRANALAVVQGRCASCHDATVAQAKGDGLALTSGGKLSALDARQADRLIDLVGKGKMPPPKNGVRLEDGEKAALAAYGELAKRGTP